MFGIATKDAVVLSSTTSFGPNRVTMKDDFDWVKPIGKAILIGFQVLQYSIFIFVGINSQHF